MKFIKILIPTGLAFLLINCSDNRESLVKDDVTYKVESKSKYALGVISLKKTDGYKKSELGEESYMLEWEMELKVKRNFWKAPTEANFFLWGNYSVIEESDYNNPQFHNQLAFLGYPFSAYGHFHLNDVFKLSGKTRMFKTEKGWRIADTNITRYEAVTINPN